MSAKPRTAPAYGPNPWVQQHWDARAAANFAGGGAGAGLVVCTALAGGPAIGFWLGAALVALGLLAVAFEIGRPLRSLNVYLHPQRSWMTREALLAPLLLAAALAAGFGLPFAAPAALLLAIGYAWAQARILRASKGIPAWRAPALQPLMLATALAEGAGAYLLLGRPTGVAWTLLALALAARWWAWTAWRRALAAPAQRTVVPCSHGFVPATLGPLALALAVAVTPLPAGLHGPVAIVAGALAIAGGWLFKHALITRCAFNQGFALPHLPVRGARRP
jgi:phenylacetyl-CoA:acceptor oxidoreductase subunit 2